MIQLQRAVCLLLTGASVTYANPLGTRFQWQIEARVPSNQDTHYVGDLVDFGFEILNGPISYNVGSVSILDAEVIDPLGRSRAIYRWNEFSPNSLTFDIAGTWTFRAEGSLHFIHYMFDPLGQYQGQYVWSYPLLDGTKLVEVLAPGTQDPDIAIYSPENVELPSNPASISFGSSTVGQSVKPHTFTLKNTGLSTLSGLSLSKVGVHAEELVLSSLSRSSLGPGETVLLTVDFIPQALGVRTASVYIESTDPDENPFILNFEVVGLLSPSHTLPLVKIETVSVGDAGNPGIETASGTFGGVANEYLIGKHEVTVGQYVAFLNSVASAAGESHLVALWNPSMSSDLNVAGVSRRGAGTEQDPYIYEPIGSDTRPIAYVSWLDAARFVNWLHNGATNGADTEGGAYTLNGATNGAFPANPDARWYLPSMDEWFKAAFYKGAGTNSGYWAYPTQSDEPPGNFVGDSPNQANYRNSAGYSVTQSSSYLANRNYLTDVGAFSGSPSAYGTYDQAGNLREWVFFSSGWGWSNAVSATSGAAGADWNMFSGLISSVTNSMPEAPEVEDASIGFRVAAVHPSRLSPSIVVEQPAGTPILNDMPADSFGNVLVGTTSTNRSYTIRNAGILPLELILIAESGLHTNDFAVTRPPTDVLSAGETTTFEVQWTPSLSGSNSAEVSVISNDTNNSSFKINLSGFGLGEDLDSDGDGLNDAAEFSMSQLGFDWQTAQAELVGALFQSVGKAGFYSGQQYEANRAAGIAEGIARVTDNPTAYNLFTESSIMDMRLGGLILKKNGNSATFVLQPQTTADLANEPFTSSGAPITNTIPMPGGKGFLRIQASPVGAKPASTPQP